MIFWHKKQSYQLIPPVTGNPAPPTCHLLNSSICSLPDACVSSSVLFSAVVFPLNSLQKHIVQKQVTLYPCHRQHPTMCVKKSAMVLLFCCSQFGTFPRARGADSSNWNFILWESLTAPSIYSFKNLSWLTSVHVCRPDYQTSEDSLHMKFTHRGGKRSTGALQKP